MTEMKREGLVLGMDEDEYHGGGGSELSSTGAKLLLQAPALFKDQVLDRNRVEKKAWSLGTAVHSKVLGVGAETVACPPGLLASNGAMSTKDAKAWKAVQEAAGKTVVSASELAKIKAASEAVLAHPDARAILELEGDAEASVFATCPETGVRLRGRFDRLAKNHALAGDLKSVGRAGGANEAEFLRTVFSLGYDVQAAQYIDTLNYATGRDVEFVFIVVELTAPHLVNVIRLSPQYLEMGRAKSMEARRRYKHGLETGEWPGYPYGIKEVEPPMYAVYDFQDNYEDSGEMTF